MRRLVLGFGNIKEGSKFLACFHRSRKWGCYSIWGLCKDLSQESLQSDKELILHIKLWSRGCICNIDSSTQSDTQTQFCKNLLSFVFEKTPRIWHYYWLISVCKVFSKTNTAEPHLWQFFHCLSVTPIFPFQTFRWFFPKDSFFDIPRFIFCSDFFLGKTFFLYKARRIQSKYFIDVFGL